MTDLIHVSNFSGGLCSFFATQRIVQEFGTKNAVLLFADTLYEDQSLYDFNRRAEDLLGVQIVRISQGINIWELFRREGLIGHDRFPICSTKLKREPLNEWMEAHYELDHRQENMFKPKASVVLGFDFSEWNRVNDFQNAHPNWTLEAPMTEPALWDKCKMIREAERLGFTTPQLYDLGFPHNNCGGRCVKAGITHWVHLYRVLPESYLGAEREERDTRIVLRDRGVSNWQFTILKDRRGGETKPLSLESLRLRIEAGEQFPSNDWGGCGCGGDQNKSPS
jgi:hypothetical protein